MTHADTVQSLLAQANIMRMDLREARRMRIEMAQKIRSLEERIEELTEEPTS